MECGVHSGAVIVSFHKCREGFYNLIECQILSTRIKMVHDPSIAIMWWRGSYH